MPMLYLRCKTCDTEFASGISVDNKSFETLILSENHHICPEGHTHTYDKKDYGKAHSPLKEFLKKAFIPWTKNPGWNIDAICVLGGLFVWAIVVIGNAYGFAKIPTEVTEIGKAAFFTGIGRSTRDL